MMDLAKEVINQLRAVDLNGVTITNIECLTNETRIAFLISDIEVFFTARNAVEYVITSIVHQGQVFDDPNVLSQYDAWVKYVTSKVLPIVEVKRLEIAEVAYRANIETLQPEEHAVVGTGEYVSSERLEEAQARGRKEGFKAARKKNVKEIKDLKKKYNIIIAVTVVGLILAFTAIWLIRPNSDGYPTPPPIQQETGPESEDGTVEGTPEGETEGAESINDENDSGEENDEAAANLAAALIELGEAFEFDDLEITFGTQLSWDDVENRFSEYDGATVFRLPITITNRSDETHGLNMFSYTQFGPNGAQLEPISSFFDNDVDWSGDMLSGDTQEAYMHFLFDGNGDYKIEFNNSSERLIVKFYVQQDD
jgi:hypothetical protein